MRKLFISIAALVLLALMPAASAGTYIGTFNMNDHEWAESGTNHATWGGTENAYITTVEYTVTDTIITRSTGGKTYWFDMDLVSYSVDDLEVSLDVRIRSNTLTNLLQAPSLASAKLDSFNSLYTFEGRDLDSQALSAATAELLDIPVASSVGEFKSLPKLQIGGDYTLTVEMEEVRAGFRRAKFKIGSNSFEWSIDSQADWENIQRTTDNIQIVDGWLVLENTTTAPPNWWDVNWDYRVPITLNSNSAEVTENYQYRIVLDNVDNLGGNVSFENFQDIRFTMDEDDNTLPFWRENWILGDNCVFWVRVEDNTTDNTIYAYYGNSSASHDTDNGENTFPILFCDFENNDNSDWEGVGPNTIAAQSTVVRTGTYAGEITHGGGSTECRKPFVIAQTSEFVLEFDYRVADATTTNYPSVNSIDGPGWGGGNSLWMRYQANLQYYDGVTYKTIIPSPGANTWHKFILVPDVAADTFSSTVGQAPGIENIDGMDNTGQGARGAWGGTLRALAFGGDTVGKKSYVDQVFAHTYAATLPTCDAGAEETPAGGITYDNQIGEWFSNSWEIDINTYVENLTLEMSVNMLESWDVSTNTPDPWGLDNAMVAGVEQFTLMNAATDRVNRYNYDTLAFIAQYVAFSNTANPLGLCQTSAARAGDTGEYFVCDYAADEVDNYDIGMAYNNAFDVSNALTGPRDCYFDGENLFVISSDLNADNIVEFRSAGLNTTHDISETHGELASISYDNTNFQWYILTGTIGDRIYQYDNDFNYVGCVQSVGADDSTPAGVYTDTENLYMLGNATATLYKYYSDNTLENVYAMILVDYNGDNVMDDNTGWHLMPENGYWVNPTGIDNGRKYQVGFRIESDDNSHSPRIGAFSFNVEYQRDWQDVESWGLTIHYQVPPLYPIDDLATNLLVPLLVLFAPALMMADAWGSTGFVIGMILGTIISYIGFGFTGSALILVLVVIGIIWYKKGS